MQTSPAHDRQRGVRVGVRRCAAARRTGSQMVMCAWAAMKNSGASLNRAMACGVDEGAGSGRAPDTHLRGGPESGPREAAAAKLSKIRRQTPGRRSPEGSAARLLLFKRGWSSDLTGQSMEDNARLLLHPDREAPLRRSPNPIEVLCGPS